MSDECKLCGGCGEVECQDTDTGQFVTRGCPDCISRELNGEIKQLRAALKKADAYLTRVEGQGEGGIHEFDVAAEAVRSALQTI